MPTNTSVETIRKIRYTVCTLLFVRVKVMEHTRIFRNNISSTFEEILERHHDISLSTLLNIQRVQNSIDTIPFSSDNHVIDVEDQPTNLHDVSIHDNHHYYQTTTTDNFLNDIREAANEVVGENTNNNSNNIITYSNNNNNNGTEENSTEAVPINRVLFKALEKYIPFVCILFTKGLYDHRATILNFIVLLVTFNYTNNVLKREIAKKNNKSWVSLLIITCYIVVCIVFIYFEYDTQIFSSYIKPAVTIWELLWSILIIDFILKLITIVFKVFLTCLPSTLLALQKRGKYFLMVEATSQLSRCIIPVQPWLYYFFESYQGSQKIIGILLCLLYTVSKGTDLLARMKLCLTAVWKLIQNVSLGVSPSKEQLVASGGICSICHDQYSMPVRLHCKHIFCETCVLTWLNCECSCPLCRAAITDNPIYQDGHTSHFIQLY